MKRCFLVVGGVMALVPGGASADILPKLVDEPWLGWYAGWEARGFRFGIKADGEGSLVPYKRKDEDISTRYWIDVQPVIEEVLPGRLVTKKALKDGWEAVTPEGIDPEKVTYRGTVTGGATFEVTFEVEGKTVRGGGRILDKGELTEHPIQLAIRVRIPNVYYYQKDEEKLEDFAKRDKIDLLRTDGKKLRFNALEPVWGQEQNGPGIKEARVDLEGYQGGRVELSAGNAGAFEFWNAKKDSLYKGFTLGWKPDPAKDPKGEARFELTFK